MHTIRPDFMFVFNNSIEITWFEIHVNEYGQIAVHKADSIPLAHGIPVEDGVMRNKYHGALYRINQSNKMILIRYLHKVDMLSLDYFELTNVLSSLIEIVMFREEQNCMKTISSTDPV